MELYWSPRLLLSSYLINILASATLYVSKITYKMTERKIESELVMESMIKIARNFTFVKPL